MGALLLLFCLVTGRGFYLGAEAVYGYPAWQIAAVIQVVCWIAQVISYKFNLRHLIQILSIVCRPWSLRRTGPSTVRQLNASCGVG